MADRSRAIYQAFLMPLPLDEGATVAGRLLASGALSGACSYTEAAPRPGMPEPDADNVGALVLVAGGEMLASDGAIELRLQVGGVADGGVGLCWRRSGDTPWYGRNLPQIITGWESLVWTDGGVGSAVKEALLCGATRMPNGRAVACYDFREVSGLDTTWGVRVVYWSEDAQDYVHVDVYTTDTNPGHDFWPVVWVAEDDTYVGHLVRDPGGVWGALQLRVWRSSDDGATWALAAKNAVNAGETLHGLGEARLSVAYREGQAALVQSLNSAITSTDTVYQWASPDVGLHFVPVGDITEDVFYGIEPTILATDAGFELYYLPTESTDDEGTTMYSAPGVRTIASAFSPLVEAPLRAANLISSIGTPVSGTWRTVSGNEVTAGSLTACVDHDGRRWLYGSNEYGTATHAGLVLSSLDGIAWQRHDLRNVTSHPTGSWCRTGAATAYLTRPIAVAERGRVGVFHNWLATTGNEDDSLSVLWLGGWETATPPQEQLYETWQLSWDLDWLPIERPQDLASWTWATSGTAAMTLANGRGELVTTAGTATATVVPTATVTEGFLAEFDLQMDSGGAVASLKVGAVLTVEDGTDSYTVQLRVTDAGSVRVWDPNAGPGASVGDITISTTARFCLRAAICKQGVRTWYRAHDPGSAAAAWIAGPTGALASGTPGGGNVLSWGVPGSDTAEVYWYRVHLGQGSSAPVEMVAASWANPGSLKTSGLGSAPLPLDRGTTVAAVSGIGQLGDTYTITAGADYALSTALAEVAPSPRRGWRSEDLSEQLIVWELGDESSRLLRDGLALTLYGINFRTSYLEGSTDGASWTSLATLDAAKTWTVDGAVSRTSLRFLRHGRTLSPDSATSGGDTPWIHALDLPGGLATFGGAKPRRIGKCSSGRWRSASVTDVQTPCRVELLGLDGTESASGTNLILCAPRVAAVVQLAGVNYRYVRLRIPNQVCVDTHFKIGTMLLGYVAPLGQRTAKGSRIAWVDGAALERQDDGEALVYQAAPPHRELELGWSEGIDTRGLWWDTPDVDYIAATDTSGAPPVATPQALPMDLEGLWMELGGVAGVAGWCRWLPQGSPDAVVISDFERFPVLVRLTGPPDRENLFGDEADSEVIRVSIVATEEV